MQFDLWNKERKEDKKPFFLYLPYNAPHYGKTNPNNAPENTINLKDPTKYKGIYDVSNTLQAPSKYLTKSKLQPVYFEYQ